MSPTHETEVTGTRLEDIIEALNCNPDLPFILDDQGKVVFCGQQSIHVLNKSPEEVEGKDILSLVDDSSSQSIVSALTQLSEFGGSVALQANIVVAEDQVITREMILSTSVKHGAKRFFGSIRGDACSISRVASQACDTLRYKVGDNITRMVSDHNLDFIAEIFTDIQHLFGCSHVDFYEHIPETQEFKYAVGTGAPRESLMLSDIQSCHVQSLDEGQLILNACPVSFGLDRGESCIVVPAVEGGITWGILVLASGEAGKVWDKMWIDAVISILKMVQSLLYTRRVFRTLTLDKTALLNATRGIEEWIRESTKGRRKLQLFEMGQMGVGYAGEEARV